ncbi:K(+)-transporting ATPase subunit F [Asticcacaulis taihuensis]|jgi:K+-transporting ATPase KdpF subunit|nr:K(+)-transporting ATPase subunit F [Asticcacaulis taihuensis]
MTALYIGAGILVLGLLGYLLVALIKPEIFP